ncbi:hypothetical protein RF11_03506 [Thelohanellus kitauei]|uniref:Uncharacterized protein n=1 Tax=Thelohanellus kitauei TaxID=669202 RepID=A0A0C2J6T8_THEKT|nr:hypothetical protein RF11_03506 [Thelohanellus kitauei]
MIKFFAFKLSIRCLKSSKFLFPTCRSCRFLSLFSWSSSIVVLWILKTSEMSLKFRKISFWRAIHFSLNSWSFWSPSDTVSGISLNKPTNPFIMFRILVKIS